MISIIDINIGNIGSVAKAFSYLNVPYKVVNNKDELLTNNQDGIVFPGVGSFSVASQKLQESEMGSAITKCAFENKTPLLGICLGMQMLATSGMENGYHKGLGLIDASVNRINDFSGSLRVPHMGWNSVDCNGIELFNDIPNESDFYFVHSYCMQLNENVEFATTNYNQRIIAFVRKENIYGAQFHPEKSQIAGLKLLRNFASIC